MAAKSRIPVVASCDFSKILNPGSSTLHNILDKMPTTKKLTVAVIGAGLSGITAVKCALDEGLEPTCFEQDDKIGKCFDKLH